MPFKFSAAADFPHLQISIEGKVGVKASNMLQASEIKTSKSTQDPSILYFPYMQSG